MPQSIVSELLSAYAELRRWLSLRLRNPHDAADVAQSSFEQVYAYAAATPVASPRALLFSTARSLCIDRGRRRQVEARYLEAFRLTPQSTAPSAERVAVERQALERITARLARLPRKRREAFVLVRVYGHSHAEAAARLQISVASVEKHVVRATLDCSELFVELGAASELRGTLAEPPKAAPRGKGLAKAGAVFGLAMLAFAGARWHLAQPVLEQQLTAGPAQLARTQLPDGSSIEMAAASRLHVALYRDRRIVRLEGGEARFDVARDAARPFIVQTRAGEVRVIGTAFTVRDRGAGITVTVERGRVAFAGNELTAGERLAVVDGKAGALERMADGGSAPWRSGWIVFDDVPLAEALAEINAWRREPLRLADARAGEQRLTGSFRADDPEGALRLLPQVLPVEIRRGPEGLEIGSRP